MNAWCRHVLLICALDFSFKCGRDTVVAVPGKEIIFIGTFCGEMPFRQSTSTLRRFVVLLFRCRKEEHLVVVNYLKRGLPLF